MRLDLQGCTGFPNLQGDLQTCKKLWKQSGRIANVQAASQKCSPVFTHVNRFANVRADQQVNSRVCMRASGIAYVHPHLDPCKCICMCPDRLANMQTLLLARSGNSPHDKNFSAKNGEVHSKNLDFFGDCAPKKWPYGQAVQSWHGRCRRLHDLSRVTAGRHYDCVDQIVVNAYFQYPQSAGGFRSWWRLLTGSDETLDRAHLERMAGRFKRRLEAHAKKNQIPFLYCEAGERKHDKAEPSIWE